MGLLQQAFNTFESAEKDWAGKYETGKEPLAPIFHAVAKADIEITVDAEGSFVQAGLTGEDDKYTIFPVTEDSAGRSSGIAPHPLCEKMKYLVSEDAAKDAQNGEPKKEKPQRRDVYISRLREWSESEYTHPMLAPILTYVENGTITGDLKGLKWNGDSFVRWRVLGLGDEGGACWTNRTLQERYIQYYLSETRTEQGLCMITGEYMPLAKKTVAGVAASNSLARLISLNEKDRESACLGRFRDNREAMTVGAVTCQKAHNALKWVIANQGRSYEKRTFVCWNPQGGEVPKVTSAMRPKNIRNEQPAAYTPTEYKEKLRRILNGWKTDLPVDAKTVVTAFDAATQGRLAVVYYNEMYAEDFLERLKFWDETCCWPYRNFGIQSPSLYDIARLAYGRPNNGGIDINDKILKNAMSGLIRSRVDKGKIPADIEKQLVKKAERLMLYGNSEDNKWLRDRLLFTVCAVIKKYRHDYDKKEEEMALEPEKKDRSYQFGRLLAVMEKAEKAAMKTGRPDTGKNPEDDAPKKDRETNAIHMQEIFVKRPLYATEIILAKVKRGYYEKLPVEKRAYYEKLIGQIMEQISAFPFEEIDRPLGGTYVLGYYLQKNALYAGRDKRNKAEATLPVNEKSA